VPELKFGLVPENAPVPPVPINILLLVIVGDVEVP
jgi:hypothetical protein